MEPPLIRAANPPAFDPRLTRAAAGLRGHKERGSEDRFESFLITPKDFSVEIRLVDYGKIASVKARVEKRNRDGR